MSAFYNTSPPWVADIVCEQPLIRTGKTIVYSLNVLYFLKHVVLLEHASSDLHAYVFFFRLKDCPVPIQTTCIQLNLIGLTHVVSSEQSKLLKTYIVSCHVLDTLIKTKSLSPYRLDVLDINIDVFFFQSLN